MFVKAIGVLAFANAVLAICPGFNYGIGNLQSLGNGINRWTVYNDNCDPVDGLTTNQNPCTEGIFGCSPPPIIFNRYTNTFSGLIYACRTDPNSGVCGNDVISVCTFANAICPGYNFGVGNVISEGFGISRWQVYDDNCNPVDSLSTDGNPCNSKLFTCSPPPILFTSYTGSTTGLKYACRPDPNSGVCGVDVIPVCCLNDGN